MQAKVSYSSTRLHFKAAEIEPLSSGDEFRVITPVGVWQMSKSDFYRVFPNVVASVSYSSGRREYHYTKPPAKSDQFRITTSHSEADTLSDLENQLRRLEDKVNRPFYRL